MSSPTVNSESGKIVPYVPPKTKKSIYDNPEEEFKTVDETSELELAVRKVVTPIFQQSLIGRCPVQICSVCPFYHQTRHSVTAAFASTRSQFQGVVDSWIKLEQGVSDTVKAYAVPGEPLLPGAIYVTLAGFAGSIISKNRRFLIRAATPTAFTAAALGYYYPRTSRNVLFASESAVSGKDGATIVDFVPNMTNPFKKLADGFSGMFGSSSSNSSKKE
ncbi:apolipo protein O-domain-containing protein [Gaertneriomyces semiglobifer]|nr:apolipo protein O-domain-containing protein [Gaertneriomyces semiglobifer]